MKYSISYILSSIFICIIAITFIDNDRKHFLNIDKIQQYCCCNIDEAYEYFKDSTPPNQIQNGTYIYLENAFCHFDKNIGENDGKLMSFQMVVRFILKGYNNYTFPIKIMSFYNNNYYCKKIWKNKSMDKSFWNTKCYSILHDKF